MHSKLAEVRSSEFEFGQRLSTVRRLLKDYEKRNTYFNQIRLIDLNGRTILAEPAVNEHSFSAFKDSAWFLSTLKNELHLAITHRKQGGYGPVILLSRLVYDFEDNATPVGLILFDIKLSAFTKFVSSIKIGSHGYACLWDSNGQLIYHPEPGYFRKWMESNGGDQDLAGIIERIRNRETGSGDYTYKGIPKSIIFAPCNTMDWRVSVSISKSELMADIIVLRNRMLLFFILLTCMLLVVSFFFGKSISTPVRQLTKGVRAIAGGRWDHYIQVDSRDELQDLAHEFNTMSRKLKKSIDKITELKNFNDDILRSVHSGIVTINQDYLITSCNPGAEEILGITLAEFKQTDPVSLCLPAGEIFEMLKHILDHGQESTSREIQFRFSGKDAEFCFVEVNTSPLKNLQNHTVGAIAIIRDITRKKFIEEQMVRVDRLASLGELSAGMAHEIRNPLAGIKTGAQMLARELSDPSSQVFIQGIFSEIDRMNKIITDLLHFSRSRKPQLEEVNLLTSLERSLGLMEKTMKDAGISLERDCQPDFPRVLVDREQMEQVFLNLLLNGVKSMSRGGCFFVSMKSRKTNPFLMDVLARTNDPDIPGIRGLLEIVFQDTGHGIKKEILFKVFNPFYTTDPRGSGLGLPIVQKLLEKNRGVIHINSVVSQGTRVTLFFPINRHLS
ncbi:MAG: cache domain-containing protein [Thermodesulfobacteriota bacterium]|nr:cache domain-containing protein [Thermodesulfobacteriota bacterium]